MAGMGLPCATCLTPRAACSCWRFETIRMVVWVHHTMDEQCFIINTSLTSSSCQDCVWTHDCVTPTEHDAVAGPASRGADSVVSMARVLLCRRFDRGSIILFGSRP